MNEIYTLRLAKRNPILTKPEFVAWLKMNGHCGYNHGIHILLDNCFICAFFVFCILFLHERYQQEIERKKCACLREEMTAAQASSEKLPISAIRLHALFLTHEEIKDGDVPPRLNSSGFMEWAKWRILGVPELAEGEDYILTGKGLNADILFTRQAAVYLVKKEFKFVHRYLSDLD